MIHIQLSFETTIFLFNAMISGIEIEEKMLNPNSLNSDGTIKITTDIKIHHSIDTFPDIYATVHIDNKIMMNLNK